MNVFKKTNEKSFKGNFVYEWVMGSEFEKYKNIDTIRDYSKWLIYSFNRHYLRKVTAYEIFSIRRKLNI